MSTKKQRLDEHRAEIARIEQRLDEHWDEIASILPPSIASKASILGLVKLALGVTQERAHLLAPNGAMRDQLVKLDELTSRLLVAIDDLNPALGHQLNIADVRKNMVRLRKDARRLTPKQVAPTGGSDEKRADRALKENIAGLTGGRLLATTNQIPTTSVGSRKGGSQWIRLVEILFTVATGRDPGDVSRACSTALKEGFERRFGMDKATRIKANKEGWFVSQP
jgi:hypothetical protein